MMVVHEDNETAVEVAVIRKPLLEQKSYVIVKNHVRELINSSESIPSVTTSKEKLHQPLENVRTKKRKSDGKPKKTTQIPVTSVECDDETNIVDKNDLEELRTVYIKCKEVMRKIESKYGRLLDLDSEAGPSSRKKRKLDSEAGPSLREKRKLKLEDSTDNECDCKLNTKIVFDDDGKQSTVETVSEKHICVKKAIKGHSEMRTRSKTIAIEYTEHEIALPDSLPELASLLQDPDIEEPLRNKIINKMRILKQEYVNDIKFNKHVIIEKLKTNPDEVLGFKGTNLSTIPGYL